MKNGLNSVVVRRDDVSMREYTQGTAVLAFDIGQAFQVNELGAEILSILETPKCIRELIDFLSNKYDVSSKQIVEEVQAFLNDCSELGVIKELPDDGKR